MHIVAKAIREVTGLTLSEFCDKYLDSQLQAFRQRLIKNNLYANEAFLICLITGKSTLELFGANSLEVFYLAGKDSVSNRVKQLLDKPNAMEKVNILLNDSTGLKIELDTQKKLKNVKKAIPKTTTPQLEEITTKPEALQKAPVASNDFDFVDPKTFK